MVSRAPEQNRKINLNAQCDNQVCFPFNANIYIYVCFMPDENTDDPNVFILFAFCIQKEKTIKNNLSLKWLSEKDLSLTAEPFSRRRTSSMCFSLDPSLSYLFAVSVLSRVWAAIRSNASYASFSW